MVYNIFVEQNEWENAFIFAYATVRSDISAAALVQSGSERSAGPAQVYCVGVDFRRIYD